MQKYLFTKEYEFYSSPQLIFPYLSTAEGLAQWFADEVKTHSHNIFHFNWANEEHIAKVVAHRKNKHIKYEIYSDKIEDSNDPNTLEFILNPDELTQTVYLKINDYSEMDDDEELNDIWDSFVYNLKSKLGG